MKHGGFRGRKVSERPVAWRDAEYAGLRVNGADTRDDRVGEDIFDVEDARAQVEANARGMMHDSN